jgi:integrase/recombinase XerD
MKKIKPPKRERNLRNALNLEQVEKLRLVCKTEKEKAIFEFLLSTGCRVDEVAKLNVSDINWNELSVVVKGKGSKERKIYLSIKAKVYYDQYYSMRKDNTECLFITERQPYRRLEVRSYQRILQAIGQRININLYPHLLRHTFATAMIRNGADIVTVQKLLGHEEASTTQVYAKLDDDFIYNQYKKHLTV